MKKFIKENKKTLILLLSFITLLLIFIINRFNKEEIKQPEEVKTYAVAGKYLDDKYKLKFEHYKTYKDNGNKKILVIFQKTVTDYNSNFKYYISINDKKIELETFSNDEHSLTLHADILLDSDYKIIFENQDKKDDIQEYNYKISEVLDYDLSDVTKEKFNEHEKLSHNISSVLGAIKISELKIKEKEELLKYTEDKINTFTKAKDEENIKRFKTAKEDLEKEIETLKSKKQEQQKELDKLYNDNEELEGIFDKIFGDLHQH